MLCLQVHYKNQQRKTRFSPEGVNFELLESRIRQLFKLGGKPILMFYQEDEQHKVVLIDDEDVTTMYSSLPKTQNVLKIQVKPRTDSLIELGNLHVIQRCCIKELRRKHSKRDILAKKKLKKDLVAIRKGLLDANLKPNLITQVIKRISHEVEMFFIEKMLETEKLVANVDKLKREFGDPFTISNSSINQISKSAPSLFSKTELASKAFSGVSKFNKIERFDSDTRFVDLEELPFESDDVWVDQIEDSNLKFDQKCRRCSKSLKQCIAFRCMDCKGLKICETCVRDFELGQNHSFEPFFEAEMNGKSFEILEGVLKRLETRITKSTWMAFKYKVEKT
jgi:hypothetical protein